MCIVNRFRDLIIIYEAFLCFISLHFFWEDFLFSFLFILYTLDFFLKKKKNNKIFSNEIIN